MSGHVQMRGNNQTVGKVGTVRCQMRLQYGDNQERGCRTRSVCISHKLDGLFATSRTLARSSRAPRSQRGLLTRHPCKDRTFDKCGSAWRNIGPQDRRIAKEVDQEDGGHLSGLLTAHALTMQILTRSQIVA